MKTKKKAAKTNATKRTADAEPVGAETNRRRAIRRQPTLGTICRLDSAHGKTERIGLVWNISTSGVSMLISEPIEAGSTIDGDLATTDDEVSIPVTLRVAHVSKLLTGDYIMGGQFDKPLKNEEMKPFLGLATE